MKIKKYAAIDVRPITMLFSLGDTVTDSLAGELMISAVRKGHGDQLVNDAQSCRFHRDDFKLEERCR